ncbi:MAG: M48 family metallopeptidase [Rhodospirillales bacterium]|nr:M48 family metallopeptidase [Rhodospirillales bacterium]
MMPTASITDDCEQIEVGWGDRRTIAALRRTTRRVLRIEVRPSGAVVVFAPSGETLNTIQDRVKRKGRWIFRELDRIAARPSVTPDRHFVSGETHLLLGKQYRLSIELADDPKVQIEGSRLKVLVRRLDDQAHCRRLITAFYASMARGIFRERLDAMVHPFVRRGLLRPTLIIRRMSKRWGSYTPQGRIVLNVDLVRASPMLIDYVICHELAHAFYPDHGKEWSNLIDTVMPDWETRKIVWKLFYAD